MHQFLEFRQLVEPKQVSQQAATAEKNGDALKLVTLKINVDGGLSKEQGSWGYVKNDKRGQER